MALFVMAGYVNQPQSPMESFYETRKQTFVSGNVYRIRTRTNTLVGEVIDWIGGNTVKLRNVRNLDTGYETHPLELYCVPYDRIIQYRAILHCNEETMNTV